MTRWLAPRLEPTGAQVLRKTVRKRPRRCTGEQQNANHEQENEHHDATHRTGKTFQELSLGKADVASRRDAAFTKGNIVGDQGGKTWQSDQQQPPTGSRQPGVGHR